MAFIHSSRLPRMWVPQIYRRNARVAIVSGCDSQGFQRAFVFEARPKTHFVLAGDRVVLLAAVGFELAGGASGLPSVSSRWMAWANGKVLSGPSTCDRSPTIRIDMVAGVMYSRATRSTSALVTPSTRS